MRILHCVLLLAFAILLKNVYCDSSNPSPPLHNSPPTPSYLNLFPKPTASPFEIPATNTKLDEVHPQPPTPIPSIPDVTSYLLAELQWPPGVCTAGKSGITCKKPWPAEFTIHGLWPRYPEVDPPKKSTEIFGNQVYTATYTDLILAFAIHLKNVNCDSSNPSPPLPNSPLSYLSSLPKPKASPFEIPATNTKLDEVHPQAPTPLQIRKVTSYILAVRWAPGLCYGKKEYPPFTCIENKYWPDDFTIHGLWPQYRDEPVKSTEIFTKKKVSKLRTRMDKNWLSVKTNIYGTAIANEDFWNDEWVKHGTESEMELEDYFKNTLDLYDKVLDKSNPKGIVKALSAQKIIPKNTKKTKYKLQAITDALKEIYGVTCSISCVKNEKYDSLEQFLEIRFTFIRGPGQNDFQMQNTVIPQTSSCSGTDVWFPLI